MTQSDLARLTVRLNAIAENYRTCQRIADAAGMSGVVKANAYGLGMAEAARTLLSAGCDTFFVARLEEGIALRPVVPKSRIFVLEGARADVVPALVANDLIPVLNSLDEIDLWTRDAHGRDAAIHIDTGMSRLGLPPDELAVLAKEQRRLVGLRLVLLMSHLACADDPQSPMNAQQLSRFRATLACLPPAPASLSSSGGILLGRDYHFDLVRPGIALYGGNPQSARPNVFAVAARLTARILQVRRVDKGDSVGYGATFRVGRPTTLATVAVGYADGLMRVLGNRGVGAIGGVNAPIVGRVSMDLATLDVTDVPERLLHAGADVEFFGDTISLDDIAAAAGTAPYEILTSVSARIPRRYEGAP